MPRSLPDPLTGKSTASRPELTAASGLVSSSAQLTAVPEQPSDPSSNAPADAMTETLPTDVPMSTQSPQLSSANDEAHEDSPDLATVLSVISRARLSARERQVVATVSLLVPDASTSPDLERRSTLSSPPPYMD